VLAVVVEDAKCPATISCRWQNLLHPLARYGVSVRSKRSSTVHKLVAPPCTLSMTWFVPTTKMSPNLRGSLMEFGSAP
jgi:hypothetical protein